VRGTLGAPYLDGTVSQEPAGLSPAARSSFRRKNLFRAAESVHARVDGGDPAKSPVQHPDGRLGPINEANLTLRSDPPLSGNLIFLLTTGLRRRHERAGLGEAAAGRADHPLRSIARQLEPMGIDSQMIS